MNLNLLPHAQSAFPRRALLVRGGHPADWAREMQRLGIAPEDVKTFAVPDVKANVLYGCVLLFNAAVALPKDVGPNSVLCLAEEKLLLPERAIFRPLLARPALEKLAASALILLHPFVGTVLLETAVDWQQIFPLPEAAALVPRRPAEGVFIPEILHRLRREIEPEALLAELEKQGERDATDEPLPFNLKKLLAGNSREMEKYLRYLQAHPDKALKLAIPLDLTNTSRSHNYGRFSFGRNSGTAQKPQAWIWVVLLVGIGLMRGINDRGKSPKMGTPPEAELTTTPAQELYRAQYKEWQNLRVMHNYPRTPNQLEPTTVERKAEVRALKDSVVAFYERRIAQQIPQLVDTQDSTDGGAIIGLNKEERALYLRDSLQRAYGIDAGGLNRLHPPTDTFSGTGGNGAEWHLKRAFPFWLFRIFIAACVLGAAAFFSFFKTRKSGGSVFGLAEMGITGVQRKLFYALLLAAMVYVIHPAIQVLGLRPLLILVCCLLSFALYRLFGTGAVSPKESA